MAIEKFGAFWLWEQIIYGLIVVILSSIMYAKSRKLYSLSSYKGFKYFKNAFLFYALGFLMTILMIIYAVITNFAPSTGYFNILFSIFMSMAGFSLVYSLVWKKAKEIIPFHKYEFLIIPSIIIAFIDYIFFSETSIILFIAMLIVHAFGMGIAHKKYKIALLKGNQNIQGLYFILLTLSFLGWIVNFVSVNVYIPYNYVWLYAHLLTIAIFALFLFGLSKIKKS